MYYSWYHCSDKEKSSLAALFLRVQKSISNMCFKSSAWLMFIQVLIEEGFEAVSIWRLPEWTTRMFEKPLGLGSVPRYRDIVMPVSWILFLFSTHLSLKVSLLLFFQPNPPVLLFSLLCMILSLLTRRRHNLSNQRAKSLLGVSFLSSVHASLPCFLLFSVPP